MLCFARYGDINQENIMELLIENFLEMLIVERDATANTVTSYKTDLEHFTAFLKTRELNYQDINTNELQLYVDQLISNGLSSASVLRKVSAIKQLFSFLLSIDIRNDNPTVPLSLPKKNKTIPKHVSEGYINDMLSSVKDQAKSVFEVTRNLAMLEILYASGMRVSELITLKVSMLQRCLRTKKILPQLIIKGKGNKERLVFLTPSAIQSLEDYLQQYDKAVPKKFLPKLSKCDWLFPSVDQKGNISHISRQRFGQILKEIAVTANLSPEMISPHKIRHSFASLMLKNGGNLRIIQELLGHADISSTQIYTKVFDEHLYNTVLEKHPLKDNTGTVEEDFT